MPFRNALPAAAAAVVLAVVLAVVFASPADCQPVVWSAPVLGYVYDASSKSLRAVGGVPGAAALEDSVPSAAKLQSAHVAPGRRFAIAETIDTGIVLIDWSPGEVAVRELTGAITELTSVAFSPGGSTAVLASKSSGKVQVWRGLPDNPSVQREMASEASAVAASDDGIVAGVLAGGVYRLDGEQPVLLAAGTFSAIAFRPGTQELAAVDHENDVVLSIRVGDGDAAIGTLASSAEGISQPVGLAFSIDGATLAVANQRGRSATILTIDGRGATTIACDCTPTTVAPALGTAVFRITDSTDQPLTFLDAGSPEPRIFLVTVAGGNR